MFDELIVFLVYIGFATVVVIGLFFIWFVIIKAILKIGGRKK